MIEAVTTRPESSPGSRILVLRAEIRHQNLGAGIQGPGIRYEVSELRWGLSAADEARQLVEMLGHSVEHAPEGRVDLLACSLLKSREGREVFDAIERETKCNFAASDNKTGNPKNGGDWIMESDNVDIRDDYFMNTDEFSGTFAAHGSSAGEGVSEAEVERRIAEAKQAAVDEAKAEHEQRVESALEEAKRAAEAEKQAAVDEAKAEHEQRAKSMQEENKEAVEAEKQAAIDAVNAEHDEHVQSVLEEARLAAEVDKQAAIDAVKAEHEQYVNQL
ncbi:MAG: hypothetical protein CMN41_05055, partial [SAR116 cluster bacterium]